jgi:hypothetical protein
VCTQSLYGTSTDGQVAGATTAGKAEHFAEHFSK